MLKAILVGINSYPKAPLEYSVSDAEALGELLLTNGDQSPNFDARVYKDVLTKGQLMQLAHETFQDDCDISLFYFSGHGMRQGSNTYLVTPDAKAFDPGVSLNDLLVMANEGKARHRVIVLDCCHSGAAGIVNTIGGSLALINQGVTILAACRDTEQAMEIGGHSLFTHLLLDALRGGAADMTGHITLGSIYAYIDRALGAFEQRPVFKTNITGFFPLRRVAPKVAVEILRRLTSYFPSPVDRFHLDPSYEFTNAPEEAPQLKTPHADSAHTVVFKELQKCQSAGLLEPVDAPFMYHAAMNSKSCRLTPLGQHYWYLASKNRI